MDRNETMQNRGGDEAGRSALASSGVIISKYRQAVAMMSRGCPCVCLWLRAPWEGQGRGADEAVGLLC